MPAPFAVGLVHASAWIDRKISALAALALRPLGQRNELIRVAGQERLEPGSGVDLACQLTGNGEHHVFLASAAGAARARVLATMARVDGHHKWAHAALHAAARRWPWRRGGGGVRADRDGWDAGGDAGGYAGGNDPGHAGFGMRCLGARSLACGRMDNSRTVGNVCHCRRDPARNPGDGISLTRICLDRTCGNWFCLDWTPADRISCNGIRINRLRDAEMSATGHCADGIDSIRHGGSRRLGSAAHVSPIARPFQDQAGTIARLFDPRLQHGDLAAQVKHDAHDAGFRLAAADCADYASGRRQG